MKVFNITMFGIVAVSLHVGIVNVFVFHAICIPILTLTHSGKIVAAANTSPPSMSAGASTPMIASTNLPGIQLNKMKGSLKDVCSLVLGLIARQH